MRPISILFLLAPLLPAQQPASNSYFPLEVGDHWVYRADSRVSTGGYQTWRIDRTETINGKQYFALGVYDVAGLAGENKLRVDDQGRILILTGDGDQLFLDPRPNGQPGQLQPGAPGGSYKTAVGTFDDTLLYTNSLNSVLLLEHGQLARGVGLLWSSTTLLTGSSGGFTDGRVLVEAVVGGGTIRYTATAGFHVGIESLTLDVTGKNVTNCILPCYFAACGLGGPQPDPPGTYKPCARARVSLENWPLDASHTVHVRFIAPDTTVLSDQKYTLPAVPGDVVDTVQVPLYSAPNSPYPPGTYQLNAFTEDSSGQTTVAVTVK
jgi:hypothetical protein